jgi:S-DNA-T family DNA segregation ATPase FtsK/SpoIIIE
VLLVSLLPSLLPPAILGLVTYLAGASSTIVITSMALGGSLGLAIVVTTILSRRDEDARIRGEDREYQASRAEFESVIAAIAEEGDGIKQREARILARDFPPPSDLAARTTSIEPSTWERRPSDSDFLEFRLGLGRRPSCLRFKSDIPLLGADPLIRRTADALRFHTEAPVTVKLSPGTRAGSFGADESLRGLIDWLVLQAAAGHAPTELAVAILSRDEGLCSWAKWLPHARLSVGRQSVSLVARSGAEASRVLRALVNDLRAQPGESGRTCLVVADARDWESLPARIDRWLPAGTPGVALLLVQRRYEELAGECEFVIDVAGSNGRVLRKVEGGDPPVFAIESPTHEASLGAALALAPVSVSERSGGGPIPASSRLADILGGSAMAAGAVREGWERQRMAFRLAAPIGVGPGDETVEIDLRRDGPHGLLAGTTGSGKSEFLQSLVVSLATRIPPDLLNFVLIDYKGGSAFADVATLPHVVGVVTDLNDQLAARALASLRAEMKRRERLIATITPQNIIEYQSKPREVPMANLLVIIDEFHRLVTEQPDFIKEMVQIAAQGRAWGVHLLLSTQKPSGVISDDIRANTALRICLRVTDEADSRDVLGTPEAAHIPRDLPGRVYIRVGNEPLRVCQAGRVSGKAPARRAEGTHAEAELFLPPLRPPAIRRNGLAARPLPPAADAADDDRSESAEMVDERELILAAIKRAATEAGFPVQQPPWTDPLPETIDLAMLLARAGKPGGEDGHIIAGMLDEPELQRQRPFEIDLAAGHVLIAGAANTGKTSALLSIAAAAVKRWGPADLHVYGIDFAGGGLSAIDRLPHSGGVAAQHQPARVRWVLQALKDFVAERLTDAERRSGWPRVLVLVDNFPAFATAVQDADGQDYSDDLFEVLDLGRSAGITFAVAAERPEALRSSIMALMHTRLALQLADAESYTAMGLPRMKRPAEITPGRATVPGHVPHEVQLGLPTELLDDGAPAVALPPMPGGPMRIGPLPPEVAHEQVLALGSGPETNGALLLGLLEGTRPLFRFPAGEHLVVLGPRQSGRSNALAVALSETRRVLGARAFIVNPRRSPVLRALRSEAATDVYAERANDLSGLWDALSGEVRDRFTRYAAEEEPVFAPLVVVVDDAEVLDIPSDAVDALQQVVLRGGDVGMAIYLAADTQALRSSYPSGVTRALLNLRAGILLNPSTADDFDLFGARGRPSRLPPGRGYWCQGGAKHAVQVAWRG